MVGFTDISVRDLFITTTKIASFFIVTFTIYNSTITVTAIIKEIIHHLAIIVAKLIVSKHC